MRRNALFLSVWLVLAVGILASIFWPRESGVPWLPFWVVLGLGGVLWALALLDIPRVWRAAVKRRRDAATHNE
jgi:hypothetical protein